MSQKWEREKRKKEARRRKGKRKRSRVVAEEGDDVEEGTAGKP
jgi:hypothetical protein